MIARGDQPLSRVFGPTTDRAVRISGITAVSVDSLRGYLDTPEFHLLLQGKNHRVAVHEAVWNGNLESVLDEYLTTLAGLGEPTIRAGREEKALKHLQTALALRTSSIEVRALTQRAAPFKLRCHAALPLGLGASGPRGLGGGARGRRVAHRLPASRVQFAVPPVRAGDDVESWPAAPRMLASSYAKAVRSWSICGSVPVERGRPSCGLACKSANSSSTRHAQGRTMSGRTSMPCSM